MSRETPSQNGENGRDSRGRFAPGNSGGPGNATARKAATFRAKLFDAVSVGDFAAIVARLLQEAKGGESWAVKLTLEYLVGPPQDIALEERLQKLETLLSNQEPEL